MAVVEAAEEVRPGDSPSGSKSDKAAFLPARSFSGWRHGYYFRLGDAGLGYYLDVGAEAAEAIARSRRDGARSHSPPSTSRHLETPATDHPPMKRDLFEWFHKRVLARFSGRYLVDAGHLRVRVVSVWPHGRCGVVDAPDADVDAVAVACDVGVSVEWRAEFTFPGSDGALGSVSGRVKVASARLLEDGRVETGEVEVLVGGEKSRVERERDDARSAAAAELEPRRSSRIPTPTPSPTAPPRQPWTRRPRMRRRTSSLWLAPKARAWRTERARSCATRARGASWRRWFEASPTR